MAKTLSCHLGHKTQSQLVVANSLSQPIDLPTHLPDRSGNRLRTLYLVSIPVFPLSLAGSSDHYFLNQLHLSQFSTLLKLHSGTTIQPTIVSTSFSYPTYISPDGTNRYVPRFSKRGSTTHVIVTFALSDQHFTPGVARLLPPLITHQCKPQPGARSPCASEELFVSSITGSRTFRLVPKPLL